MACVFECLLYYSFKMKCVFERAKSILEAKLWHAFRVIEMALKVDYTGDQLPSCTNGFGSQYEPQIWSLRHRPLNCFPLGTEISILMMMFLQLSNHVENSLKCVPSSIYLFH